MPARTIDVSKLRQSYDRGSSDNQAGKKPSD